MTKSRGIGPKRHQWTDDDIAWLVALYPDNTCADVALAIGCTQSPIYRMAAQLGLAKSPEHLAAMRAKHNAALTEGGKRHRFPPGTVPPNKGRRGYHAPGAEKGWFQKGHQRNDTAAVGEERIDSKDGYILVKIADRGNQALPWRAKHRLVWEAANGPIPPGHVVAFIDRNKLNCAIGNLELITQRENMARNSVQNLPQPLLHTVQVLSALKRKINGTRRKQQQHAGHAEGSSVRHIEGTQGSNEADGSGSRRGDRSSRADDRQ